MKRFAVLAVVAAAATILAGLAVAGGAAGPTSVSISVSPGGATCAYSETATPKVTCAKLVNQRIKSGTGVTLVAKTNAALPAGWKLFIAHQYVGPNRNDFVKRGGAKARTAFPLPYLCTTTTAADCSKHVSRNVIATTFDLYRAVVQKPDGTNFEAQMYIRWCDKSTPGCVS
jgi:hypothetical protein